MDLISKADAKKTGLKHYFTGKVCPRGHVAKRFVSTGSCFECAKEKTSQRQMADPSVGRKASLRYYHNNAERCGERAKEWDKANPGRRNQIKEEWRRKNLAYVNYKAAERAQAVRKATPLWLTEEDRNEIKRIYLTCPEGYEVDHIVPLKGKTVCGLHVPANLQHLPALDNRRKGNRFPYAPPIFAKMP